MIKSTNFGKPYVFKRIETPEQNDLHVISETSKEEVISGGENEKI